MEINELISMLTEGLEPDQAKIVRDAVSRDSVKAKASSLKQAKEYETLQAQYAAAQAELEGDAAQGKLGTKAYKDWYDKNYPEIQKVQQRIAAYQEKYGTLEAPKVEETKPTTPKNLSDEDIQRIVDSRFQATFAPNVAGVVKNLMKTFDQHRLSGRKTAFDVDAIEKLMAEKGLPIEKAYEEWDKPEREKEAKAAQDKEVERRVQEALQKRGVVEHFPAGADATPGALSSSKAADAAKFDKAAMEADLINTYMSGKYPGEGDSTGKKATGFFGPPN